MINNTITTKIGTLCMLYDYQICFKYSTVFYTMCQYYVYGDKKKSFIPECIWVFDRNDMLGLTKGKVDGTQIKK